MAGTAPVQLRVSKRRIGTPLYGVTPADLLSTNSTVVVTLSGVDETVTQMMYALHPYAPQNIFWNYHFVDLVSKTDNGDGFLDYKHFNSVVPVEVAAESRSAAS